MRRAEIYDKRVNERLKRAIECYNPEDRKPEYIIEFHNHVHDLTYWSLCDYFHFDSARRGYRELCGGWKEVKQCGAITHKH